jgi:hypothetical protein
MPAKTAVELASGALVKAAEALWVSKTRTPKTNRIFTIWLFIFFIMSIKQFNQRAESHLFYYIALLGKEQNVSHRWIKIDLYSQVFNSEPLNIVFLAH